jgi:hypothetical protein
LKKADEWRRLLTVTPVILWYTWKGDDDEIPDTEPGVSANEKIATTHSRKRKSLYDAILLLCAAIRLLSTKNISMAQAKAGHQYLAQYCQWLIFLGCTLTINHHISMHFSAMIKLFGPVYSWWLFAFERFNGMLEKVKTNGRDGGKMELTMLRNWVQTHLIYELLIGLPDDASPPEKALLDCIINTEASRQRGGMMTEIAIFRSEASSDRVSLPKRLSKSMVNLHNIRLQGSINAPESDLYSLLFNYFQLLWPDITLRRQLSLADGIPFIGSRVARKIMYVRKDSL